MSKYLGTHIAAITETRFKTALHLEQLRILTVDIFYARTIIYSAPIVCPDVSCSVEIVVVAVEVDVCLMSIIVVLIVVVGLEAEDFVEELFSVGVAIVVMDLVF